MEEKKFKFSTAFLVVIILIIIVGIAYLFVQNMELTNKQQQGEKQIQTLQEKIQEFENKISNTNTNVETNTITENQVQQTEQNVVQNNTITPAQTQTQTTTETIDYTGTYRRVNGDTAIISKNVNGELILSFNNYNYKLNVNEKRTDGSITIFDSKDELDRWFIYYYPVGTNLALSEKEGDPETSYKASDNTKIRLLFNGSSQEFLSDIFYKVN